MPGDGAASTPGSRLSRRGVLALLGSGVVAGCSGLAGRDDGGEATIQAHELPDVDPDDRPAPVVAESVPVDVAAAHLDAARTRITTLLATLPTPLGPEEIPNGHVRMQLADAGAAATDGLDEARDAPTELVALEALRQARTEARYAAAGWAFADRQRSVDTLRQEYGQAVSAARSVRDAHEYVGTDPVRAAVVHARIEEVLAHVIESDPPSGDDARLLQVAEWGQTAESAQAHLEDARHLAERMTASLPADVGTLEDELIAAGERLLAEVRSRQSEVPPEPTAEEWGLAERAVDDLRWEAANGVSRLAAANGPASAVVDAHRRLTHVEALTTLERRIDDGELSRPRSAAAVRQLRATAIEALETALAESPAPALTRTTLAGAAWRVASADWALGQYKGEISAARLEADAARYVVAAAIGRVAPDVSERTVEVLRRT